MGWLQGKIWGRSTPVGPVMVTADEFDPAAATLRTTVNGETMQEHGIGDLDVIVPRSADVIVRLEQGIGDARVFGSDDADDGRLVPGTGSEAWTDDGEAEFVLTIDQGIGDAEVSRG